MRISPLPASVEAWDAWRFLLGQSRRAGGRKTERSWTQDKVQVELRKIAAVLGQTAIPIDELGLVVSTLPGEDDREPPASRDIASYLLDHLIANLQHVAPLASLLRELVFPDFVALLVLYADRVGDEEGVKRAYDIWRQNGAPYADQVANFLRRAEGGRASGQARHDKNGMRNKRITQDAQRLREEGKPDRELAGILAKRHSLGPRQVRNILRAGK